MDIVVWLAEPSLAKYDAIFRETLHPARTTATRFLRPWGKRKVFRARSQLPVNSKPNLGNSAPPQASLASGVTMARCSKRELLAPVDYAAIGTESIVASQLCGEAKPEQILINPRVLVAVEDAVRVEPVGEFELKGIRRLLVAYNVVAAATS